jgi:hypothetical protein
VPELSDDDLQLLARVREVYAEIDPVPSYVIAAAKAAIAWRSIDSELAELVEDTELTPASGVRSGAAPRLVTFEADTLTVEVEIAETGDRCRRLMGQLVPPSGGEVEIRNAERTQVVEADDLGRFSAANVPPGPVSLVCRLRGTAERPVVTSWIVI